jgi:membrane fusion protein (multidrug efflux system)
LVALIVGGVFLWRYMQSRVSTDDAQVDADISAISARVSGVITAVYVNDNQYVHAGDLLAELDPADLIVAVEQAEANLGQAEAQAQAQVPAVPITNVTNQTAVATGGADVADATAELAGAEHDVGSARAQLEQAEAQNKLAQIDRERSQHLFATGAVSQAELDQRTATADATAAELAAARSALESASKRVDQQRARLEQAKSRFAEARTNAPMQLDIQRATVTSRQGAVKAALAALDQAKLNLSYARIVAPVNGIVGKKSFAVGDHVQPGQQLLGIVQTDDLWVTANFKETQLRRMHPGQRARISVDAFRTTYDAAVESMPGASGARFSLFPPENATGNFVKVVQRLPVRLRFVPGQSGLDRLRPGMSVEPKVFLQ